MEYPGIRKFVKSFDNVEIIRPKMNFKEVVQKYGYPVISKESAYNIYYARKALEKRDQEKYERYALGKRKRKDGSTYSFAALNKLGMKLLESDIPVSNSCCKVMKERPAQNFERETGRMPIIAVMAEESVLRTT